MSRYIEQEHIGKTISNLPTEVFQTENRIDLVLSATEVIDAIKDAPSIDIVRCGECKHENSCEHRVLLSTMWNEVEDTADIEYCSYGERKSDE